VQLALQALLRLFQGLLGRLVLLVLLAPQGLQVQTRQCQGQLGRQALPVRLGLLVPSVLQVQLALQVQQVQQVLLVLLGLLV